MLFCSVCNKLIANSGYEKVHYGVCSSCPVPDALKRNIHNALLVEVLNLLEQTEGLGMDEFSKYRREFERLDMLEELNTNLSMVNAELNDELKNNE